MPANTATVQNSPAVKAGLVPPVSDNLTNWWYAYNTNDGSYGIARSTAVPGNAVNGIFIGEAKNLIDLATHDAGKISDALRNMGTPAKLQSALIAQLDTGAILHNPSFIQAGKPAKGDTSGQPSVTSDKPTAIGSSAVPVNVVPSPIDPSVGNSNLLSSLSGISSFFSLIGSLQFWKGIGLVLAGALILIFAGVMVVRKT